MENEVLTCVQLHTLLPDSGSKLGANDDDGSTATGPPEVQITWANVVNSLENTRPSISSDERRKLHRIYEEFVGARSGEMKRGGEDASREVGGRSSLM